MTWLAKLRTYLGHDEPSPEIDDSGKLEAASYLNSARSALGEAQQRRDEARAVTSKLNQLNVSNHYGESIYLAMLPREKRV